jgi:hypothetical protein
MEGAVPVPRLALGDPRLVERIKQGLPVVIVGTGIAQPAR